MYRLPDQYKNSAGCPHTVSACPVMATADSSSNTPAYVMEKPTRLQLIFTDYLYYRGADKFLARPGRKQATATEYFEFHISYLYS